MSNHSDWDVQKAVHARLCADAAVTALLPAAAAGICDGVQEDAPFPYIAMGELEASPLEGDGAARDIALDIRVVSKARGFAEVRALMAAVSASLHEADIVIDGHRAVLCREVSARTYFSGAQRHGVLRFRIVTEPAEA